MASLGLKKFCSIFFSIGDVFFSVSFIWALFFWLIYDLFYNRLRKIYVRLIARWGVGSVLFMAYIFLYCFLPALAIGFFVYFFMPCLLDCHLSFCCSYCSVEIILSVLKLSFFVGAVGVLLTAHPRIKKLNIKYPYFMEAVYILIFLRMYTDSAYRLIQPYIFTSSQYARLHPALYAQILIVFFVFWGEKYLFNYLAKLIKPAKLASRLRGFFVQLIPLIIISQIIIVSFNDLRHENAVREPDPRDIPSFNVMFQSYFVNEIMQRYTDNHMGSMLAECVLAQPHYCSPCRKYSVVNVSPIVKLK